jgi:hypothetical protein
MDNSGMRSAVRAVKMFATFVQAISRINNTATINISEASFPEPARVSRSLDYSRFSWKKEKGCSKRLMNTGFRGLSIPFRSIHRLIQGVVSQQTFSFYSRGAVRADFSGGQLSSDAGLLPLRAFDQRYGLTAGMDIC